MAQRVAAVAWGAAAVLALAACSSLPAALSAPPAPAVSWSAPQVTVADGSASPVRLNQLGYLPHAAKWAVAPAGEGRRFRVLRADTGAEVFAGEAGGAATWPAAGQSVRLLDFSALQAPGRYRVVVDGLPPSDPFVVAADAYAALQAGAQKAFYFNRASTELRPEHAGPWARPAGHPDTQVRVHASAAGPGRPEGTVISSPKGWYDAGDYNKYIVNSGISVYTLLAAYEHFPEQFRLQRVGIPESGQGLPDLLAEVLWNLDWMLSMQDPADGGVYHKLTNLAFDGNTMPHQATGPRYVVQKGTAATLDFAAVMAVASRVYAPFEAQRPGLSARCLQAARQAWAWALAHPQAVYRQPADVHTGEYGDPRLDDEFAWAAAELYISTGEDAYWDRFNAPDVAINVPGWGDVKSLAWVSLAHHGARLTARADRALVDQRIRSQADALAAQWKRSAYGVAMEERDFVWGSNAVALNQALMLVQGYRLTGQRAHLDAAQAALDYVLGRNPLGLSMVTGFGARLPLHPHHRPSMADGVAAPVPGFIVAGPNPGQQDRVHCTVAYPSKLAALSYVDSDCSYASNEVAINWNAPLVYLTAALQSLTESAVP